MISVIQCLVIFYSIDSCTNSKLFDPDWMLDVENRTQIPNVSPPGVLKSILRVSVINVGEVTCWAGAPGLPSLSILSQQMLFLIPSDPRIPSHIPWILSFPLLCVPTASSDNLQVTYSFLSYLFSLKVHQLKIVFIFVPWHQQKYFYLKYKMIAHSFLSLPLKILKYQQHNNPTRPGVE